ncbi:MAG TPA: hypothetical protein VER08_04860 [Pyrinomonadaceae bacterium]|nr:hypothetical protein [Pyrinomonadaceae bacterium]
MLFIQSRSLALTLDRTGRLRLLDALAARGLRPLVRSTRRRLFQLLAPRTNDAARLASDADELERECAAQEGADGRGVYTPGELFCAEDGVLALVFGAGLLRASVVYNLDTAEPLTRLERFCRDVRESLSEIRPDESGDAEEGSRQAGAAGGETPADAPEWETPDGGLSQGLARFIAVQPAEFVRAAAALRGGRELARASELMEEQKVRAFLRRVQEMRREGYTPRRLFKEAGGLPAGLSVETMAEAGLLEREVRVSCRKSGHALFDLPSPDSLAAVTLSRAKCSLCAAPVADEVVEETFNPTRLALALLEGGGWLTNRVYKIIRSLGVPESCIANGPVSTQGESNLAVEVCGNSFLFVTRDGDLTPAFCRRVVETVEETDATHLVVVVTGSIEDEGRLRLYEFVWRRARDGRDLNTTLVEGLTSAREQVERAFATAVRRQLSRDLHTLDDALGFSAANFVLDWFRLTKAQRDERDATSAPSYAELGRQVAS